MDVPEVRRRVRAAIESAKRDTVERRTRVDAAGRDYEQLLATRATPVFHQLASALVAEGHRFKVFTPAGSVRLASERSPDNFIELTLDTASDPPAILVRSSAGRGRRAVTAERPIREGTPIADLTESDILEAVLADLVPLL
jgi:hypothetical protein